METAREKVINYIKNLPGDISIEEIIERLKFIDSVNKGLEDLDQNITINHEESKRVLKKWLE